MPHKDIRCNRCWRNSYTVPIGMIVIVMPNSEHKQINVCKPHIEDILKWLQVSVRKDMKLPRLPKDIDRTKQLNIDGVPLTH